MMAKIEELKIETKKIEAVSRYMGWWCGACGQMHFGKNKDASRCIGCGRSRGKAEDLREQLVRAFEKLGPVEVLVHIKQLLLDSADVVDPERSGLLYKAADVLQSVPLWGMPYPHRMDAPGGPECRCGRASRHESGWCGECKCS